jgi:hypothetical protein
VREDLEQVDRMRTSFLANISHEIRTPMNGVLGMTELMLLEPGQAPENRERLELIRRSGLSLVTLINDLLDVTKMAAGKLELELLDFDLQRVLSDVSGLFEPLAREKGLALQVDCAGDVPTSLRGDALRVQQVLSNLLSNAVKFTEKGSITLEVRCASLEPLALRFAVRDTGVGIDAAVLPRLFTPFAQADASTTRRYGGTGLGLALCRQLATLMGGTLEATSGAGGGSTFTLQVPFTRGLTRALPRTATPTPDTGVKAPVLVVDDNPINLKVAAGLLKRAGYPVHTAVNGREALEAVQRERYLLVLMDCQMPEMDGFAATEAIRSLDGDVALTPVVALTASAMPDELEACRRAGMNDCLTKPVTFDALLRVLRELEHYRALEGG